MCSVWGNFNLIREAKEKTSGNINTSWAFLFNDWTNKWGLMEYNLSNRVFTWSNNQDNTIFAAIDRVFSSTNWDAHFPLTTQHPLAIGTVLNPAAIATGVDTRPMCLKKLKKVLMLEQTVHEEG